MRQLNTGLKFLFVAVLFVALVPAGAMATLLYRNSAVVSTTIPTKMVAGTTKVVQVRLKNTGKYTWLYRYDYKLKALSTDPFTKTLTYRVGSKEHIARGQSKTFYITLKAPTKAGTYTTDWRMSRGTLRFGTTVAKKIQVVPATLSSIAVTKAPTKVSYLLGDNLDLTGLVVTGTYNNGTKKVLPITASNISGFNSSAPALGQVVRVTVGGKVASFTVAIVDPKPAISAVHISSNSAKGANVASNGDVITLTFTSNQPVTKLSNFKINGSNPDTFTAVGNVYTATHLVDSGDQITGQPATFQINVKNADGIFSQTVEVTNDGSSVTIVDPKPVISAVHIESSNGDKSTASNGDVITLTFTSDEPVSKLSNFKINGSNPDTFTNVGNVYTATHLVDSGDAVTGQPATFQINVKNAAGIYSQTVEVTNDGSSVTITAARPIISAVHIESNGTTGTAIASDGDTITLTFTSNEPVFKLGTFKINGSNPDSFTNVGNVYTVTHLVDAGDQVTGQPATFQINVKNAAGIYSQTVESTNDGSSVTIVR